tara:strand:- start:2169 stop:2690 length:522 start_codon:yes stop_codon:yes gene_type:complete
MPKPPRSLKRSSQILKAGKGQLRTIYDETRRLQALHRRVAKHVYGDIDVASFSNGDLHLITPSAASATRIRYRQKILISELNREQGPSIGSLRVSVRPVTSNPLKNSLTSNSANSGRAGAFANPGDEDPPNQVDRRPARELSRQSAEHLAETAKYTKDDNLRKALERLSKRGK